MCTFQIANFSQASKSYRMYLKPRIYLFDREPQLLSKFYWRDLCRSVFDFQATNREMHEASRDICSITSTNMEPAWLLSGKRPPSSLNLERIPHDRCSLPPPLAGKIRSMQCALIPRSLQTRTSKSTTSYSSPNLVRSSKLYVCCPPGGPLAAASDLIFFLAPRDLSPAPI